MKWLSSALAEEVDSVIIIDDFTDKKNIYKEDSGQHSTYSY